MSSNLDRTGHQSTVTIDDHGRPFETTDKLPLSKYGDLYEYDWADQHRLLHLRTKACNPDDCSADLAERAPGYQGVDSARQVLSVDCAGNAVHVEDVAVGTALAGGPYRDDWLPGSQCLTHHLGLHQAAKWVFFASRTVCSEDHMLGALFTAATIRHPGCTQVFANAFGSYIVSLVSTVTRQSMVSRSSHPAAATARRWTVSHLHPEQQRLVAHTKIR